MKKKAVKKRTARQKPDALTALLETLSEYYKTDALTPGINLAILPYAAAKPIDKKLWYGSMSRYVRNKDRQLKRFVYYKSTGGSLEEVVQKIANLWYNSVMAPMAAIKNSRLKETLK